MKTPVKRPGSPGYVSYVMVLSTGVLVTMMMLFGFKRAVQSQAVQSDVQLRLDYSEKEDAVLRSIVAITPNRAMQAMMDSSSVTGSNRNSLMWQSIFSDAMAQANARTSISAEVKASLNVANAIGANTGDGAMATTNLMFGNVHNGGNDVYVTPGLNRTMGTGYPASLTSNNGTVNANDLVFPIISTDKKYGSHANGKPGVLLPTDTYWKYNVLKYPAINFGYAKPGDDFVAKRNWWAFSMDMADHDDGVTSAALNRREFVLSIYEIPSQLAISASSFVALGKYGKDGAGGAWGSNVSISGNIYAGKARVEGGAALPTLASRRQIEIRDSSKIGGQSFNGSPFAPGTREQYEVTTGEFFPVSLPSESGRAAFIPINRGEEFFDRYSHGAESNTLSTTTWNNYSSGAAQCAMRVDVSKVASATNQAPTEFRFEYLKGGVDSPREVMLVPPIQGFTTVLPRGFKPLGVSENNSYTFTGPVDVAYGKPGGYFFKEDVSGTVVFDNATFGDPLVQVVKEGYWRPRKPFTTTMGPDNKVCVGIYPERFPDFLAAIGANPVTGVDPAGAYNNSVVVNVDHKAGTNVRKPIFQSEGDLGLVLAECADLTKYGKGFSLVTNLRLYIGSDYNTKQTTPPPGYTPPNGEFYPPTSLFAPEKRFGVQHTPLTVTLAGQVGSLANENNTQPVRPLDVFGRFGEVIDPSVSKVNLWAVNHPGAMPPIMMINWLVLLEERRKEYY